MAQTSTGGTPVGSKSALMQQLRAWKHSGLSQQVKLDTTGVSKTLFSAGNGFVRYGQDLFNRSVTQRKITLRNSTVTSAYLCG